MKVNILMIKNVVKAHLFKMEKLILVNLRMINVMDLVLVQVKMVIHTLVCGRMTNVMEKVL